MKCCRFFSIGSSLNRVNPLTLDSRQPISWHNVERNSSTVVDPSKLTTCWQNIMLKPYQMQTFQQQTKSLQLQLSPRRSNGQSDWWKSFEMLEVRKNVGREMGSSPFMEVDNVRWTFPENPNFRSLSNYFLLFATIKQKIVPNLTTYQRDFHFLIAQLFLINNFSLSVPRKV